MKALTLWEPWASLWASGVKVHETRGWPTHHRGELAVHAARRWGSDQREAAWMLRGAITAAGLADRFAFAAPSTLGRVVGIVRVVGCYPTERADPIGPLDRMCGDWSPGRYAWATEGAVLLDEPIPCQGHQGIWELRDEIETKLGTGALR